MREERPPAQQEQESLAALEQSNAELEKQVAGLLAEQILQAQELRHQHEYRLQREQEAQAALQAKIDTEREAAELANRLLAEQQEAQQAYLRNIEETKRQGNKRKTI